MWALIPPRSPAWTRAVILLSLLLACLPKRAAAPSEVDAIFEASIEAAGGRDAMLAHHNVISRAVVETPGAELMLTIYHQAPDALYTTLEVPGVGVIASGYRDGVAWELNPIMGPRLLSDDETAQEAQRADFYATLHYARHYPPRRLVGPTELDGVAVWEVSARTALGDAETLYFDIDTGLLRGSRVIRRTESGAMASSTTFQQHGEFGGILLPVVMTQRSGGVAVVITLESVHYDVETMPSMDPPPTVQALIDREVRR
jgi:hypothetical protein